jgi:hypothetical protein
MMMRSVLVAALLATTAMCHAVPAAATPNNGNNGNNNGPTNTTSEATAGAAANATGVGLGIGVGMGGHSVATGGAGGDSHSSATGGVARNDIDIGLGQTLTSSQGQSQDQRQGQQQGQSITDSGNASQQQKAIAKTDNANNAKQEVNITNPRSPVSSAFSTGTAGVGTCRFGPGAGFQFITEGYNFTLPVFKDRDCRTITYFNALLQAGQVEAAVQFLAARDREVAKAVTQARKTGHN